MNTEHIRRLLLQDDSDEMQRRRKIVALSALGLIDFGIISLYQTGVLKKLPDLPFAFFDSNKVNKSPSAYLMGVPDGPVSATVYALNMVLATAGGLQEAARKPVFDVLLAGTILGHAAGAVYYLYDMIVKQKKICLYCVAGAVINLTSAVIIAPVVLKNVRRLFRR